MNLITKYKGSIVDYTEYINSLSLYYTENLTFFRQITLKLLSKE